MNDTPHGATPDGPLPQPATAGVRDEVGRALAPRPRTCPSCGATSTTALPRCPECGASLVARGAPPRTVRRPVAVATAAAVVAVVALAVIGIAGLREDASTERSAEARRSASAVAAERARLLAEAEPRRRRLRGPREGESDAAYGAALVGATQRLVTEDARARVLRGTLEGPVGGTVCRPAPTTEARRLAERSASATRLGYDCTVVRSRRALTVRAGNALVVSGHPYKVVVDRASATVVWCKVSPRAGEGGAVLASVPVPAPCRQPRVLP